MRDTTISHLGRKVTKEMVLELRSIPKDEINQSEMAIALGISQATLSRILNGKTYKNVYAK